MKWYIHIGIRKTGSKAIQNFIANEHYKGNLCFPPQGRQGNWHRLLHSQLQRGESSCLDAAVSEYGDEEQRIGVFSYEAFFCFHPQQSQQSKKNCLGQRSFFLFESNRMRSIRY